MKYIYYHPVTKQVEAVFETPNLTEQASWHAKGLTRAVVPDGMVLKTRDFRIDSVVISDGNETVETYSASVNPVAEPGLSVEEQAQAALRASGKAKLAALGLTDDEINSLMIGN